MNSFMSSFLFPLLGVAIIVFCLLSFVFPYGERFKDKIQKIKGFGVDLEVSVITLFILIGVILSFTSIYLQLKDYQNQLASAKTEVLAAQKALVQSQKMEITALVTLEGVAARNDIPKLEEVRAEYYLSGSDEPMEAQLSKGYHENQFRVTFKDITRATHIRSLVVQDRSRDNPRRWTIENFMPFEPFYNLAKEKAQ